MEFNGKIAAIKALRAIKAEVRLNETTGVFEIRSDMGLKEAKDAVEAIMRLGVRSYLEERLRADNRELDAAEAACDIHF